MRKLIAVSGFLLTSYFCFSQDPKPIVGVAEFTSEIESKYSSAIAEKVVQVVTKTKRFIVVDRTSYDKVKQELEFQKSEAFLNSKETSKQDAAIAAQFIISGHISKINVYAMKNTDGSINGYKASTAFSLKVNEVETGKTTEAESFQSDVSSLMLSPESAVTEALKTVESKMEAYFSKTFPLNTKIAKVLTVKKDNALTVLILGGKEYGFSIGDRLVVEQHEIIDGKLYPSQIGELKVVKLAGSDFSECTIIDGGKEILSIYNASGALHCRLLVK